MARHNVTMTQFLDGLSQGQVWAWILIVTLALIALAILIRELDDRKPRTDVGRDLEDSEARRWLNGFKAKKTKAGQEVRKAR